MDATILEQVRLAFDAVDPHGTKLSERLAARIDDVDTLGDVQLHHLRRQLRNLPAALRMSVTNLEHLEQADQISTDGGVPSCSPDHESVQRLLVELMIAEANDLYVDRWTDAMETAWQVVARTVTRFVFAEVHTPVFTRARKIG